MRVFHIDFRDVPKDCFKSVACIGFFDGLHKGHQTLVERALVISKERSLQSALITFDPDPWTVFKPDFECKHMMKVEDKIEIAKNMGIDAFYVLQFSKEFSMLTVEAFHELLNKMNVETLICGFDFRYGFKNSGNINSLLKQDLFRVEIVDCVHADAQKIASSRIEPLVMNGDVLKAAKLCGFVYSIQGIVVHGFKRGSTLLGIPTANLLADSEYILPKQGVYAGLVSVDEILYKAMINIGANPTFDNESITIEAHILDFDQDIYGRDVRFYFLDLIREENKFNSLMELKEQLLRDIETSRKKCDLNYSLIRNTAKTWNKSLLVMD